MTAVKPQSADAFLKAPPRGVSAVLLHGGDPGLVSERAQQLARRVAEMAIPPGEILRLDDNDLDADPDRLVVELGTIPMFGGRKIIRANQSRKLNAAMLKPLIEGGRIEGFLIVEAGQLKAEDAMRALFEKADAAAAIACYADEARDLDGLVRDVLAPLKLDITPEAKRLLISRLGADRQLSRAEIEKLGLYALGKGRIEEDDVEAVVGDASEMAVHKIIQAAANGRAQAALSECERAVAAGESPQYVIIAALKHFQRLHRVRMSLESGASIEDALRGLRPPVFFKQKDAFVAQVEAWSSALLTRGLQRITETQRASRAAGGQFGSMDEAVLTESMLLDLARLAASRSTANKTRSRPS
jgi:DNA polymerase-3 subunit delta